MRTSWQLSTGAAGIANWSQVPALLKSPDAPESDHNVAPPQVIAKETTFGSVTIFRDEFGAILDRLRSIFNGRDVAVTATIDGRKETLLASDFLRKKDLPNSINECLLGISSGEQGIQKSVSISLLPSGQNKIIVQSADEIWTSGNSIYLSSMMKRYTSYGTGLFKSHALDLNFIVMAYPFE